MGVHRDFLSTIKTIDTPLKLLAFIVVVFAVIGGVVVPNSDELVQLTTIVSLGLIVALSLVVLYAKWDLATTQVDPILGVEHLPLHPGDVRVLRSGKWRCNWKARNEHGDLKDYVSDTISINKVDQMTGIIQGFGTPVYENAEGYEINGRVSKKGFAHLYYKSGWPHEEKIGLVILQFDFREQTAEGWWLGGLRDTGIPVSGSVVWKKDSLIEGEWKDKPHQFEYYEYPAIINESEGSSVKIE